MKIFALELSSAQGSIAWHENDREPFERTIPNNRKHSGMFFETLQFFSKQFGAPDLIVVGLGPGSYAGVRIAIAAAVGLRLANGAKLVGLPSICALDTKASDYWVIGDARRQSFFSALISNGELKEGPALHSATELELKLADCVLPVYASETLSQFSQAILAFPSARRLAELLRDQSHRITDNQTLEPIYLREPHITWPETAQASAIIL